MIGRIPGPKRSAEILIEQPISVVWDVVSDSGNFSDIIQGGWYWGPFDRSTAKAGTIFQKGKGDYYIVNWDPPRQFSMGDTPNSWVFDFSLTELGMKTKVRYTRRFNILGWLPFFQGLMSYTVNALNSKCIDIARKNHAP